MARKDLVKHDEEKTNEHLLLMKSTLIDTQSKLADTQSNLADTEQRLASAEKQIKANHTEVLKKRPYFKVVSLKFCTESNE